MNVDVLFASPWGALLIFGLRIVDVSCDTMRVIFAIRGKRGIAAGLGFVQALVWIFAVGNAVKHLDSILHVFGYAGGYAMGTYVGVSLEQAIAYGVATIRIVSKTAGVDGRPLARRRQSSRRAWPGLVPPSHNREADDHDRHRNELCRTQIANPPEAVVLGAEELDDETFDTRQHTPYAKEPAFRVRVI